VKRFDRAIIRIVSGFSRGQDVHEFGSHAGVTGVEKSLPRFRNPVAAPLDPDLRETQDPSILFSGIRVRLRL